MFTTTGKQQMKRRTIQDLVHAWVNLSNDTQMVEFVDSLTLTETQLLEMAIRAGITTQEPPYMKHMESVK